MTNYCGTVVRWYGGTVVRWYGGIANSFVLYIHNNLSFSETIMINKCKTKCMALTKKERDSRSMPLCGNSLPWVKSAALTARRFGNKIEDKIDVTRQDMREKRSQFIQKNNEISQEFSFVDSTTKISLNNIFNLTLQLHQYGMYFVVKLMRWKRHGTLQQRER